MIWRPTTEEQGTKWKLTVYQWTTTSSLWSHSYHNHFHNNQIQARIVTPYPNVDRRWYPYSSSKNHVTNSSIKLHI